MENIGQESFVVHETLYRPDFAGAQGVSISHKVAGRRPLCEGFYVFSADWGPRAATYSVDGRKYGSANLPANVPASTGVFDPPFFILLNFAVGGEWTGNADQAAAFPQEMLVNWVRVLQSVGQMKEGR